MSESCRLWRNFRSFASSGTGLGWLLQALHCLAAPGTIESEAPTLEVALLGGVRLHCSFATTSASG